MAINGCWHNRLPQIHFTRTSKEGFWRWLLRACYDFYRLFQKTKLQACNFPSRNVHEEKKAHPGHLQPSSTAQRVQWAQQPGDSAAITGWRWSHLELTLTAKLKEEKFGKSSSSRRSKTWLCKERQLGEGEELKRGCRFGQIGAAGSTKLTACGWEMQNWFEARSTQKVGSWCSQN